MLSEASRVLRPGGQLILGAASYPAPLHAIAGMFADERLEERQPFRRAETMEMLHACDFENITWQRTGLGTGVMIAWKRKPGVAEMRSAC